MGWAKWTNRTQIVMMVMMCADVERNKIPESFKNLRGFYIKFKGKSYKIKLQLVKNQHFILI